MVTKKKSSLTKDSFVVAPVTTDNTRIFLAPLRERLLGLNQLTKFVIGIGALVIAVLSTLLVSMSQQEEQPTTSLLVERSIERLSGQVPLNEVQLRGAVALLATPVYWIGPIDGYEYILDVSINGLILVRYVPTDVELLDEKNRYTAVGTYSVADAHEVTKARGQEGGSTVGLINEDGAAVFYDSNSPLNAFLAYPNIDIQVEVFDPRPSVAIEAARGAGIVKLIN